MDAADSFYQEMDSKDLLDHHGPQLRVAAIKFLAEHPDARVGAIIVTHDAREAGELRQQVAALAGSTGPLTSLVTRRSIEHLLAKAGTDMWRDEPWQQQAILPVVCSTRDGFKIGFFPLEDVAEGSA